MICLDLLRCYYQHLEQLVWARCLKLSAVLRRVDHLQMKRVLRGSSSETCHSKNQTLSFNKQCSVKRIRMLVCSHAALAALLLLSGCSTSQSFRFFAPSGQQSSSSPLHHPKIKKISPSSGDWLFFPHRTRSQQPLQQGTSLWSQSPLWGASSDSTSPQVVNKKISNR